MAKSKVETASVAIGEPAGLAVRRVALADLHNDPANVRLHDRRNLDAIAASLKTFGQVEPLVVQKGTRKVIGGNGRLQAMRDMGLTECDVVEVEADNLTATALSIALNRTAETAAWDDDGLAATLKGLQEESFDLSAVGFTGEELDALLAGLADEATEDGVPVTDPEGEWQGMPEFEQEDQTSQFRTIVHFADEPDMRAFEELVGQKIPTNTRAIWYPKAERQVVKGSGYVSDEP